MEIGTLIAILASLLLMLLGLYVFKSKDSSSSENKKPRRRADIPNRDEDGQIIQGNLSRSNGRVQLDLLFTSGETKEQTE